MEERTTNVNISTLTIVKVVGVLLLLWFLFAIRDILLLLLISVIISSAIDPLADYLQKKRIPRGLSVLLVYTIFIGFIGLIVYLLVPPITEQFRQISESNFYESFVSKIGVYKDNLNQSGLGRTIAENVQSWAGNISNTLSTTLLHTASGVFTGLISALTVLVISFYLTAEENGMKNFVKNLVPFKHQAYTLNLVTKVQRKMGSWVLGQVILSVVIFGVTYLGLSILKVEYALVLALIAGLLEIIPLIGPIIAAVPAVFFAFLQNPPLALAVIVLYIVIQQLENQVIVPVVMSKSVGLNPVVVIIGVLVGASLGGVLGAIIAIPIISGVSIFINDIWQEQQA
jgi:predicted PurR-regulated permease PerM